MTSGKHHYHVDLLAALEAERLVPDDAACVLLVGSRARGWEHARSDLDVIVVTTSPMAAVIDERHLIAPDEEVVASRQTTVDGVRCEMKYRAEAQFHALVAKLSWDEWDAGRAVGSLTASDRLIVERLPHAVPLRGAEWLDAVVGELRSSSAFSCLTLSALGYADRQLEDVSGLWESGDLRGAVLAVQRSFVHVVDALTASCGHPGTDTKWRLRRVEAAGSDALGADEFWRLSTMHGFDIDHPEPWLDHVTHRCSQIMVDVRIGR